MSKTVQHVKRPSPKTPRKAWLRIVRTIHRGGTYNVGRNVSKRQNWRADVRSRVSARSVRP